MVKCADCGTEQVATHDSPKQQADVPIEKQVPETPRPLCSPCFNTAYAKEYGVSPSGPEAKPRPNVGDVPAA